MTTLSTLRRAVKPHFGGSLSSTFGHSRRWLATATPIVSELQEKILKLATEKQDRIMKIKKSSAVVDQVTASQVFGGQRGMPGMVTETSDLDPVKGIKYRGISLKEANERLPKAEAGGTCGLPEAAWWLLLTGEVPSEATVRSLSKEFNARSGIPDHVLKTMQSVPITTHPMTQLSIAILALQAESAFATAYKTGNLPKAEMWKYVLDDAITLNAQMPVIAAYVYRRTFHGDNVLPTPAPGMDWAGNYADMLQCAVKGKEEQFREVTRLYLMLHADHEGGNVSSHVTHTVGSALSDPYLAWAAGNCGLAGPLHGLANQECLKWLEEAQKTLGGAEPTIENITKLAQDTLASGKVVPGFGHAVLRAPDARYVLEHDFCKANLPDDPLFKLADTCYQAIPPVLEATGKVKNPWPNVDALSGTVMKHYGLSEADYYTVVFSVSRCLGVTAQQVWSRIMGVPIERPNSVTLDWLEEKSK